MFCTSVTETRPYLRLLASLMIFVSLLPVIASQPGGRPSRKESLDQLVSLSGSPVSWKTALEQLCEAAGLELELDTHGLRAVGFDPEMLVTLELKDQRLETALQRLMGKDRNVRVHSSLDHGKLLVSNWRVLQKRKTQKLPEWLQPYHNHGLLAQLDDADQVIGITTGVMNDELAANLRTVPTLTSLYIETSDELTASGWSHIGEMRALESLQVYSTPVPDGALQHLQRLPHLRELNLAEARIGDAGLKHLKDMKQLRVLRLSGNEVTDAGLAQLKDLVDLEELDVSQSNWVDSRMRITDAGLATIARFTRLRHLDISRLQITDDGFSQLGGLRELRTLYLRGTQIKGKGLGPLVNFAQLETLWLGGPWIDDRAMKHIANCSRLKRLHLSYTKIGDEGMRHIGRLGELERLSLDSRHVTNAGLVELTKLTKLKHIELRATHVTDDGLEHISKVTSLTRLDLSGSGEPGVNVGRNYTSQGFAHLEKLPNLKTLWLDNADVGWTALRRLKQLQSLTLIFPSMSADDIRRLQAELPDTRISAASGGGSIVPTPQAP